MTAFSTRRGAAQGFTWLWEMRSVNGKGLDLRLRVPDWVEGLETALRARLGKAMARGNVTLTLKLQSEEATTNLTLNEAALTDVLSALKTVKDQAKELNLPLKPSTGAQILALRSIMEQSSAEAETDALQALLLKDAEPLISDFLAMRASEGAALHKVLTGQLDQISDLTGQSADTIQARKSDHEAAFRAQLERITSNTEVDEARIAQELAILAVKADVTEELDRLTAHIKAARDLIALDEPVGRKMDFLAQEFNREVNTLCSKSQHSGLTSIGLELKAVVDQMREQIQNVE